MYRWQRREIKLNSKKLFIPKHGKNIGLVYQNSILNREEARKVKAMRNNDLYKM